MDTNAKNKNLRGKRLRLLNKFNAFIVDLFKTKKAELR